MQKFRIDAPLTKIIRHDTVTAEHWYLAPEIAAIAQPGQFLQIRVSQTTVPLLRRPISILDADTNTGIVRILFKAVGEGTKILMDKREGETVDIAGPLGTPFPWIPDTDAIMIAGGYGISPVLFLARRHRNAVNTLIYGARTKADLLLTAENEQTFGACIYTTNDGSHGEIGMVDAPLRRLLEQNKTSAVYACGPAQMLRAVAAIAENHPCFVSMESHMACGIGVCGGCIVRMKDKSLRTVCKDGPVFDAHIIDFENKI